MDRKIEFDFSGALPAPKVDSFSSRCRYSGFFDNGYVIQNPETAELLKELFKMLEPIKCGHGHFNERSWMLYFEAPRGKIEDFGIYKEVKWDYGYKNKAEFIEDWKACYPKPSKWYQFFAYTDDKYYVIDLQYKAKITIMPEKLDPGWKYDSFIHPFIEWLMACINKCIQMLKEGTYNDYVEANLDNDVKIGTVSRGDCWKVFPKWKEHFFEDIDKEGLKEFLSLVEKGIPQKKPEGRIKEFTAGAYIKAAAAGLRSLHKEDMGLSDREIFEKYVYFESDFWLSMDEDDPKGCEDNLKNKLGGHPFEVVPGGSATRVSLYPEKEDDGYYYRVDSTIAGSAWECVAIYLGVYKAGIPVMIVDAEKKADVFTGKNIIGIVPRNVFPKHCYSFFEEEIVDFMNFDDEDEANLLPYIKWDEIEKVELAD